MFKNRITEMLGIEYPIIQGALQWLSRAELVSAVSNAGGLGCISSATFPTAEAVKVAVVLIPTKGWGGFFVIWTLIELPSWGHECWLTHKVGDVRVLFDVL